MHRVSRPSEWGSTSREGLRKSSSTLPRATDVGKTSEERVEASASSSSRSAAAKAHEPKGCFCQIGSSVKAILLLFLMVAVTAGVTYWLYENKFGPHAREAISDAERKARSGKSLLDLQASGGEAKVLNSVVVKIIKDTDPDLYIDFEGNLHKVSDLKKQNKDFELEPEAPVIEVIDLEKPIALIGSGGSTAEEEAVGREPLEPSPLEVHHGEVMKAVVDYVTKENDVENEKLSPGDIGSVSVAAAEDGHQESEDSVVVIYGTTSTQLLPSNPTSSSRSPRTPKSQVLPTFTVGTKKEVSPTLPTPTFMTESGAAVSDTWLTDAASDRLTTKTVTGFLDFTTTVGRTVMIFTPVLAAPHGASARDSFTTTERRIESLTSIFKAKSSESTLTVTAASPGFGGFSVKPSIGIEELFSQFEKPRFVSSQKSSTSTLIDTSASNRHGETTPRSQIKPSSVLKPIKKFEGVTALGNGLIEVDGAIDAPRFDRASVEPGVGINEDAYHVVNTASNDPNTLTHVASTTLYSDFIENDNLGLVTETDGTLIAHGVTTVHATRVLGTTLGNGQYAQILETTTKVFDGAEVKASPVANFGTVLRVTEKPSLEVSVAEENDVDDARNVYGIARLTKPSSANKRPNRLFSRKPSAADDLKARLKSRFQQYKQQQNEDDLLGSGSVESLSASSFSQRSGLRVNPTGGRRRERQRFRADSDYATTTEAEDLEIVQPSKPSFRPSRKTRPRYSSTSSRFRERTRGSSRNKDTTAAPKIRDLEPSPSTTSETKTVRFGSSTRGRTRGANRYRNRISASRKKTSSQESSSSSSSSGIKLPRPKNEYSRKSSLSSSSDPTTEAPRITFKRFNRYSRPDVRSSLLQKILNKGGNKGNTLTEEEQAALKEDALEKANEEEVELADEADLQNIGPSSAKDGDLQTTLSASTVYPDLFSSSTFLEVATIRSPYSFSMEEGMSTRFITVTRTFTNSIKPSKTQAPDYQTKSSPLFQTETIPAPENILTSRLPDEFNPVLEVSSSIETLPAVVLQSASGLTPPLKTVTETFSTKELMLKTSILPIVVNGQTKRHTLTQSYYVTRLVEAVKTIPPMESYEFIPTKAFTDFSNVLDEAGSEKREHLLPGELEFSDQEHFLEGPHEVRVSPPPGFTDDLALIGSKFDPVDSMEKKHNPGIVNLKDSNPAANIGNSNPALQSSFLNPLAALGNLFGGQQTPGLPQAGGFNPLAAFSPEQIQRLALLQYLQNPFGGLAGLPNFAANNPVAAPAAPNLANAAQINPSKPVLRTETVFTTKSVPIFFGNKKMYTTVTSAVGVTTLTDYVAATGASVANTAHPAAGLSPVGAYNPLGGLAALQPSFTVTSQPVIRETVLPSTITKEVRITFRNTPTLTTLTSTKMVSTQVTQFVTKTVRVTPSIGAGFGANPFAALLG